MDRFECRLLLLPFRPSSKGRGKVNIPSGYMGTAAAGSPSAAAPAAEPEKRLSSPKRCVQFPQAVPRVCIQDRKYHQKRNHNRKILRRNPYQDQNHKRSDRHCFHCCNQRRQEFFCNGKPTGKCSSCNSRRRTKKESGSDACSGKQQGLPEERFCYKRKRRFKTAAGDARRISCPTKHLPPARS